MVNSFPTQPERPGSWWTVPCASRADFDKRAAEQVPRMAASQEGYTLKPWTTSVGPQPDVQSVTADAEIECVARR